MKKLFLLVSFAFITGLALAQGPATAYVLSGTSYMQNFDSLTYLEFPGPPATCALPAGWEVDTGATATNKGHDRTMWHYTTKWPYFGGQFGNYASAVVSTILGGTVGFWDTAQGGGQRSVNTTNRALGVRQVANSNTSFPNSDQGVAFIFKIANTTNMGGFNLAFHLQSTDSTSSRITTWKVDYGIGATPTSFTPVTTTGFTQTGNHKFFDTLVTASFGTALNNQAGPVWIRIVSLDSTTQGVCWPGVTFCNRATSQIDNFNLTWGPLGVANVNAPSGLDLAVLGNATANNMTLSYNTEKSGSYKLAIYDLTGRQVYTQFVNLHTGNDNIKIDGLNLNSGLYIVKLGNETTTSVAKAIIE